MIVITKSQFGPCLVGGGNGLAQLEFGAWNFACNLEFRRQPVWCKMQGASSRANLGMMYNHNDSDGLAELFAFLWTFCQSKKRKIRI